MGDIVPLTVDMIEKNYRSHNTFTGIPSGFSKLDTMTSGFQKAELIIIGARPSMGKTALALNMMEYIAVTKKNSLRFFLIGNVTCADWPASSFTKCPHSRHETAHRYAETR